MNKQTILTFRGDDLAFSAGHFTIFSESKRERLHGHNYHIEVDVVADIIKPGLSFDYRELHKVLVTLCDGLDSHFLLAGQSPYLVITEDENYIYAEFNHKKIPFLKDDALIMPLPNITLETLADWFVKQVLADQEFMQTHAISSVKVKVFNGPAHSASAVSTVESLAALA